MPSRGNIEVVKSSPRSTPSRGRRPSRPPRPSSRRPSRPRPAAVGRSGRARGRATPRPRRTPPAPWAQFAPPSGAIRRHWTHEPSSPARRLPAAPAWPRCPWATPAARPWASASGSAALRRRSVLNEVQQRTAEQLFRTLGELKGGAMKFGQALSVLEAALPDELAAPYRENLTRAAGRRAADADPDRARPARPRTSGDDWRDQLVWLDGAPDGGGQHRPGPQGALARRPRRRRQGAVPRRRRGADERPAPARPARARRRPRSSPASTSSRWSPSCRPGPPTSSTTRSRPRRSATFAAAFRDDPDSSSPTSSRSASRCSSPSGWSRPTRWPTSSARAPRRSATTTASCWRASSSPARARTGMLHADPHPGNFRLLPADDGAPGRLGVLDFGAVARLPERRLPEAMGRLIRIAADSDRRALVAGLREEGFIKDQHPGRPAARARLPLPLHRARAARDVPVHPGVDARAVRADQQPPRPGVHDRDQAQPADVVPPHPPHLARRPRPAQPARGRGAVPRDPRGALPGFAT